MIVSVQLCVPAGVLDRKNDKRLNHLMDKSTLATIKRVIEFWKSLSENDKKEVLNIGSRCFLDFLKKPEVLCLAGTATASAVALTTCAVPPAAKVPLAVTGALAGTCVVIGGVTYVLYNVNEKVITSNIYINWKKSLQKEKYKIFKKAIKESGEFDKFICPISKTFIIDPVKPKNVEPLYQCAYEKSLIEAWLGLKEKELKKAIDDGASEEALEKIRETFSPNRGPYFTRNDLVIYETYNFELEKKIIEFMKKGEKCLHDSLVESGLKALKETCEENRDIIFSMKSTAIQLFCLKNNLPDRIAENACAEFRKTYHKEIKKLTLIEAG